MTKKEFEQRIGKEVSDAEYANADAVYLSTNQNKDDFCKMWKSAKPEARDYMIEMYEMFHSTEKRMKSEIADMKICQSRLIASCIEVSNETDCDTLTDTIVSTISTKEYIRRKMSLGYELNNYDKTLLLDMLNNML